MSPVFYIVKFIQDNSVEVVPSNWIIANDSKCHWPVNIDDLKIINLVKKCVEPLEYPKVDWELFDCILKGGADSYEKAETGLEKAIEHSEFELTEAEDIVTPGRQLRKRKTRKQPDVIEKAGNIINNRVPATTTKEPIAATSTTLVREGVSSTLVSFPADLESIFVNTSPEVPHLELLVSPDNDQSNCEFGEEATYIDLSTTYSKHSLQSGCGVNEIHAAVNKLAVEQANFQKVVVRHLVNITSDLAELVRVVSKNADTYAWEELIIPGIEIPINSTEEFQNLGQWLVSPESKLKFVRYLKGIGGENTETFVKRILNVVGGDLANASNFTGVKNKIRFKDHPLMECITAAVRKHAEDTSPTAFECESIVKKWLLGSGDRHGGRAERQKRVHEQNI